ncbi:MAG: response regulator [Trueperaceae bacterium]
MIEGSLRNLPLVDVFQVVATSNKSGTLSLIRGRRDARVIFKAGRIQYAHLSPGVHLAEILVRMELVSVCKMLTLLAQGERERLSLPLGLAAVEAGYLDEEGLRAGLERQVFEVLSELLTWRSGSFSFGEEVELALQMPVARGFDAMSVLMQVAQGLADYQDGAVKPTAVYQQVGDPTKVEMPSVGWDVLAAVDGRRHAASVAAEIDLPERQAYRLLHVLERLGVIAPSPFPVEVPLVLLLTPSNGHGRLLRLLLARSRAFAHVETEAQAAIEFLAQNHPRAIVVDDHGGAGWQFVREVRRIPGKNHLPVVVLTGKGSDGGVLARARRPRAHILVKPFQELDFQQLLSRMVG